MWGFARVGPDLFAALWLASRAVLRFPAARLKPKARQSDSPQKAFAAHAPIPIFFADLTRGPERGRDCLPPFDASRRHDSAGGGGNLCLAAARFSRPAENCSNRARGNGPGRRDRTFDANPAACRSLAANRPLRGLWSRNAANCRPSQAGVALRPDQ